MTTARRIQLRSGDLFTLFIIVIFAAALIEASDWILRASVLVLAVSVAGLLLACTQLIVDILRRGTDKPASAPQYEVPAFDEADPKLMSRGTLEIWAWLVGLVCAIPIVGMPVALTLFVFIYAMVYGARWWIALLLAALIAAFIGGVYVELMHVYWPNSILGRYIDGL